MKIILPKYHNFCLLLFLFTTSQLFSKTSLNTKDLLPTVDCNNFSGVAYVDLSASGANDGTSWTDAFADLQHALRAREDCPGSGSIDTIFVAEGTYYPTPGGTNRDTSFWIPDGVVVLGGFPAGGSSLSARDWDLYETILSGDIDGDNMPTGNSYHVVRTENVSLVTVVDGFTITGGNADGSSPNNSGGGWMNIASGLGSSSNMAIRNCAFKDNFANLYGGGIYNDNFDGEFSVELTYCDFIGNEASEGGGMYNDNFGGEFSVKLTYCDFIGNEAGEGGGMYNDNFGGEYSLVLSDCAFMNNFANLNGGGIFNHNSVGIQLNDCLFSGNSATMNGGAIYNDANNSGESSPILNNCVLSGNTAANDGGAIYNDANNSGESSPILNNCVLSGNTATNDGGAIYNDANISGESSPILNNCVLSGNAATNNGGAIMSSANSGISFMVLTNCIMYQNEASDGSVFFNVGMAIPSISHSIFDEDFATVNHASLVIDYGNNKFSTNPQFVNAPPASSAPTSAGNFHLMPTSPAIDMGQNGVNTEATDLDGFARVYNATIDIGAFEWRAIDCNLYSGKAYVDISASGANDGTSWTDAFTNLQHALRARENCLGAIDTIFVAEGTYYPTPGGINRDTSFWIPDGVVVLGGFPAGGSPLSARNWDLYQTILSGDINGDNMPTGNIYHVVRTENVSSATLVDGFTITGGNANGSTPNNSGGGWYNIGVGTGNSSNPRIRNCDFSYNTALTNGGAIYNDHSFMELMDCEFLNNTVSSSSGVYGGAIYNVSSSPVLTDCKFLGNSVSSSSSVVAAIGGAIYNSGSSPILTNCEFLNNTASSSGTTGASHGGAMYNSGSSPILTNCVLSGNAASSTGAAIAGAIFNDNSSLVLTNCLLSGNIASSSNSFFAIGGALYYKNSSSLLINCVISGNIVSSSGTAAGGSIYNVNSSPQLTNCILYQNDAPDGPVFYNNGFSVPGISHSIFDVDYITVNHASIVSDNGNNQFSTDPQFVNAPPTSSAPTTAGDFHLMPSSPAINMGDPGTDLSGFFMENAGPVDLDGNPRVQNIIIDMGVYEMESCNITASNAQLSACELSNSEAEFDLESTESSVHGGMGVSYAYFTDEDATLPIVNSSAYLTTGTTIYVVVRDDITMCSDTAAITLNVTSAPIANNAMLTVCETSGGNGEFTLEDAESDVNGGMDISYAYYSDALAMTGISNPYTATDGTMVYVVVSDNNSMCSDTAAITLNVTAAPTANDAMLTECETSGGNGEFNLEDAVSDVNGNADISYDYYSDAMATSGISSPYTAMDGTTIYVVVSDDNSLCTDTAAIGLNVMGCSTVIDCNSFMGKAYVDISASGANDGTSWTNAFTDLQHALRAHEECAGLGSIDTIFVAEGTYYPTPGGTNRDTSFWIPDGVVVLGGFPKGGSPLSARNWDLNETILSGDINGDNMPTGNSYHVLRTENVSSATVVDGFTITSGNADRTSLNKRGGGWYNVGVGAGNSSNPTIRNCKFIENVASEDGGAMYNYSSSPELTNCEFSGNSVFSSSSSFAYGGAMYNYSSSPELTNCEFSGNSVSSSYESYGGAMYNYNSSPVLTNCVLSGNSASSSYESYGGAMSNYNSSPVLTNCVLSGNSASSSSSDGSAIGGAMYNYSSSPELTNCVLSGNSVFSSSSYANGGAMYNYSSSPELMNCIVYQNDASIGPVFFNSVGTSPSISHSIFDEDFATVNHASTVIDNGNNKFSTNPQFVNAPLASSAPTTAGDFHLMPTSPAIDMGLNGVNTEATDLDGFARVYNATIDMGAYEWRAIDCNIYSGIAYVDISASGANDGTSWTNAFTDLQHALRAHEECAGLGSIDTIFVAEGTYYPTPGGTNRDTSFWIPDGVVVLGGFPKGGSPLSARNWDLNETILSGDINGDNMPTGNSYHVLRTENVSSATVVDGFTITSGNADRTSLNKRGGGWYNVGVGAGNSSNPTIRNCKFIENVASEDGGAMYNYSSSPELTNCEFSGNSVFSSSSSFAYGGAMYNYSSSPELTNCEFSGNSVSSSYESYGGAMYNYNSSPVLTNCVLSGNSASSSYESYGGAMSNYNSSPVLTNCVLSGNSASSSSSDGSAIGGAMYNYSSSPELTNCVLSGNSVFSSSSYANGGAMYNYSSSPELMNCIVYQNDASIGPVFFNSVGTSPSISHSIFDEDFATVNHASTVIDNGNNKFSTNPQFVNAPLASSAPTTAGDFHLMPTSPAIDMGLNGVNTEATDLDGFARVYNATIDMGAYEWRAIDCNIYSGIAYVDISASGANDGTSWTNAFTDLQHALRAHEECAGLGSIDTIFVAEGTYYPTPGGTNRDTSFWIPDGVVVLGGFPKGGSPLSARNWDLNETILSGDINGDNMPTGNSYHVVRTENVSSATVVDGFTITSGNADRTSLNKRGGGWYNVGVGAGNSSNPTIRNCKFIENVASEDGGAMYNYSSSPELTNCEFSGNSVSSSSSFAYGGAMYNYSSSPELTNCEFSGNSVSSSYESYGGAMYNYNSSPVLTNCVLSGNSASSSYESYGGAMSNYNSSPVLTNCVLSGNSASSSSSDGSAIGGAIYNSSSSPVLTNCVLSGNSVFSSSSYANGGAMYNYSSSPELMNCIVYQNDASIGPVFFNSVGTSPSISHSIFDEDFATVNHASTVIDNGNNKFSTNPQFVNAPLASSAPTTAGDFHLMPTSPAIDMGLNGVNTEATDLDGFARVYNATIDMGAYEWRAIDCNIYSGIAYVDISASGANDGTSWMNAFTDLQHALRAHEECAGLGSIDTIFVAEGTYYPTPGGTNRDTSFWIPDGVVVLGGFPKGGSPLSARNWDLNETILSGDINGDNMPTGNSYHVVRTENVSSATVVDGFTITGGNANGTFPDNTGGGWYNVGVGAGNSSNPTIWNCEFMANAASGAGGAMYNGGNSSPVLTNCKFTGNTALSFGGAMYNISSSPVLTNCVLSGNSVSSSSSSVHGGAMYNSNSSPVLTNCVLSGNSASSSSSAYGGAMYNISNSSPVLTNCIVYQNDAQTGPVFYTPGTSSPSISHSMFDVDFATINQSFSVVDNGNNKFSTNPQFVNAPPASSAPTTAGDFHLMPSSPAINMGDPGTDLSGFFMLAGVPVDLEGNQRVQNTVIDMGVYEIESCNITASNAQLSACELSNSEAEFDLESTESTVHGGMGVSYMYYTDEDATLPIATSSAYLTVGTTVYVVVSDGTCNDTAAILLNVTAAPTVMCNQDTTVMECMTQLDIDLAFANWLDGFSNDCQDCVVNDLSVYEAPDSCGGTTTVQYVIRDICGVAKDSCDATFEVISPMMVSVDCPTDWVLSSTASEEEIQMAYEMWLASIEVMDGCSVTVDNNGPAQPNLPSFCSDGVTEVNWTVTSSCGEEMICTATFTIETNRGGEESPNCSDFSPSVNPQGEITVSPIDFLTNAESANYPLVVKVYNEWGSEIKVFELQDYCATDVWNICNNLGDQLRFSTENEAGICTEGMIYLTDNPAPIMTSALQSSNELSIMPRRLLEQGTNISEGKINVYCWNIPDPSDHIPSAFNACTGESYSPQVQPDWVMPVDCEEESDTAKVIFRTWEVFDKSGSLYLLTDTIVVFRLPKLTPESFVVTAEDSSYCAIEAVSNEGESLKRYAAWKQPVGLHDYELPYAKLKGLTYELPAAVIIAGMENASAQGEEVFEEYLECVILKKASGAEITIGDIVSGDYMDELLSSLSQKQLGYGFLQVLVELSEDPINIIVGNVYNFYPYLLLQIGDRVLTEGGRYEEVEESWFYSGTGNSPYWFAGGWPSIYDSGDCVSYCDTSGENDFECIKVKLPRLTVDGGFDPVNCDTVCLSGEGVHCGITIRQEATSDWTGTCPKTRGVDTWITQTCWASTPNTCVGDSDYCEQGGQDFAFNENVSSALEDYSCSSKSVKVHISQWQTLIDTLAPIFDFCYPSNLDQSEIMANIRSGQGYLSSREWELENPTTYGLISRDCEAEVYVPDVRVIDNCSGVSQVKAMVDVAGGSRAVIMERTSTEIKLLANGDTCYIYTYSHRSNPFSIPFKGCDGELTEVRYEAADNCWNVSEWYKYLKIEDDLPPTVVVNEEVNVSIQNKIAWVRAETFDEGSWDNCSVELRLVRRSDWLADSGYVDLCNGSDLSYDNWVDLLEDLGVDRSQALAAVNGSVVGEEAFNEKYDVAGLGTVLNEGEVELYYHNQIKWLWEDSELNGDKVVHGYLYAIAGYIAENCSSVDEHGNRLKQKDLELIFDRLFGQPGYSKVLAHLGGGWSKSVPFHCEDACAAVDVELAVFDYCCNFGIGSSRAYVEDKSSVKLVRQLPDLAITCESYNVYYKDIVESAAALGENGSENDENGVFAAMNDVFGYYLTSYVDNQGRAVDKEGNLLSESELNFDYYNISCGEESQTEQVAVIGHDGIIDWVNKVSTTTYLDTTLHSSINGVVSINCSAMSIQDVWVDLDECDQGTITRRFIIRDGCGSAGSGMTFEQVINVASACGLRESMFDLPEDLGTQDGPICLPEALSDTYFPDTIGRLTLKPELEGVLCNLVAIGKQVKSYDVVGAPTMKKYEITWIMSDWCGTKTSSTKELTYTQVVVATIDPACNVDDNTGDVSLVSGQIKTELGSAVSGVDVKAVLGQWSPIKLSTSESGDYSFSLEKGSDLTIVPSKNTGFSNGISTADIIDILSHVLQKNELDSKYKRIAADVNGNGQIEALDVLELRKLVLNPRGSFANNTSWRFFETKTDKEVYNIHPLTGDERVDFTAVKIGDVNLSSDPASSSRSVTATLNLNMSDKRLKGGEIYHIDVRSDNFDAIRGLQYTLNYADAYVSVESILPGALKMTEDNYLKYRPGVLTASWNDSEGMSAGADEVLFTIVVKAKSEALLRDILTLNDLVTKTEAYSESGELRSINLQFNGDGGNFALYQNRPNPYKGETIIGFVLPESGEAVMTIYNVAGRLMKTVKGDYSAGYNEVRIRSTEIGGSGVLYYQLTTDKHTATKKMIVVD